MRDGTVYMLQQFMYSTYCANICLVMYLELHLCSLELFLASIVYVYQNLYGYNSMTVMASFHWFKFDACVFHFLVEMYQMKERNEQLESRLLRLTAEKR